MVSTRSPRSFLLGYLRIVHFGGFQTLELADWGLDSCHALGGAGQSRSSPAMLWTLQGPPTDFLDELCRFVYVDLRLYGQPCISTFATWAVGTIYELLPQEVLTKCLPAAAVSADWHFRTPQVQGVLPAIGNNN